jgi:predicted ribosomally synthesized peptide with nif11-like leader
MSEEQLKAFLEAVKADAELQEKLNAAADVDSVVEIAKNASFEISADELQRAQAEALEDEELEGVAGGMSRAAYRAAMAGVTVGKVVVSIISFGFGCIGMRNR